MRVPEVNETAGMHRASTFNPSPSYERLLALPDNVTGEILNGQLHTEPRLSGRHGLARSALSIDIGGPFDFARGGPGGWWIIPKPEVHLVCDAEVAVPDPAGCRRERMPSVPEDQRFEVVPDWVCEILSPTAAKKDRVIKLPLYASYGVAYAWLMDPLGRTLEAFELRNWVWS
jgi:Uma2 family endonuclease